MSSSSRIASGNNISKADSIGVLNVPPMLPNAARMGRSPDVHCASSLVHWVGLDRGDIVAFAKSTATTSAIEFMATGSPFETIPLPKNI